MRTQRQLRVGEEIRHLLAGILMRDEVPWPQGLHPPTVTVAEVQVSPDLKNATAFVMPLGGAKLTETVRALNDLAGFFRHSVAKQMKLRYAPKLRFNPDNSFVYAQRIDTILHAPEVAKDLRHDDQPDGERAADPGDNPDSRTENE